MSKTVMRVMMIGLLAMLGAKAEAHYYVVAGKAKYCSVCVDAELAEHEEHPINPATQTKEFAPHNEEVEFCVTTKSVDIMCPLSGAKRMWVEQPLVIRKPIGPDDITGITTAQVEGVFTSLPLVETHDFCQGEGPPIAVLIRAMKVEIKTHACGILDRTNCEAVSFVTGKCRLPEEYGLPNVPPGTLYDCSWRWPSDPRK